MSFKNLYYKIVSIGDAFQEIGKNGSEMIISRPMIALDGERKKWGNEYFIFQKKHYEECNENPVGRVFLGQFGFDKHKTPKIFMIDVLPTNEHPPIPDYFILSVNHKNPFDRRFDLIRARSDSFSKIFSSAYHTGDDRHQSKCQSCLLLQNGDLLMVDGKQFMFSGKEEKLIPR